MRTSITVSCSEQSTFMINCYAFTIVWVIMMLASLSFVRLSKFHRIKRLILLFGWRWTCELYQNNHSVNAQCESIFTPLLSQFIKISSSVIRNLSRASCSARWWTFMPVALMQQSIFYIFSICFFFLWCILRATLLIFRDFNVWRNVGKVFFAHALFSKMKNVARVYFGNRCLSWWSTFFRRWLSYF